MWPNEDIGRKRLNILEKRGLVKRQGSVNLTGAWEFLWYCGDIQSEQHEAEMTEIQLGIEVDEIYRLTDTRLGLHEDGDIVFGDQIIPWEHECSGKLTNSQIKEKMNRYGDQPVLWTSTSPTNLDRLTRFCPSDKHLFTTYDLAVEDFHGEIWVDRKGKRFSLPYSHREEPAP